MKRGKGDLEALRLLIKKQAAQIKSLRRVCGEAYQLAGAIGAPVAVLDNLSDAAHGMSLRHKTFLPILDTDCLAFKPLEQGAGHRAAAGNEDVGGASPQAQEPGR